MPAIALISVSLSGEMAKQSIWSKLQGCRDVGLRGRGNRPCSFGPELGSLVHGHPGAAITCLAVFQEQKVQEGGTYKTPAFQEVRE